MIRRSPGARIWEGDLGPARRGSRPLVVAGALFAALLLANAPPAVGQCTGCAKGSFGPAPVIHPSVLHEGFPAAFGDFDGDGRVDLVIQGYRRVMLRRGTGTGIFGPDSVVFEPALGGGDSISGLAVGDFNGDGRLDLAVSHAGYGTTPGGIWILLGNGAGGFGSPIAVPGGSPYGLIAADFDSDGKLDLAMVGWADGGATVLFGNGDGTFGASAFLAVNNPGRVLVVADFDGDGRPDLSLLRTSSVDPAGAVVFFHTGPRTFGSPTFLPAYSPTSLATADFNNDGRPDLFVQGIVYLNRGQGIFEAPFGTIFGSLPVGILGDFNGDGRVDLAVSAGTGVNVYPGDGLGSFGPPIVSVGLGAGMAFALDVNEDGALDLIGGGQRGEVSVTLGRADGTFDLTPAVSVPVGASGIERADLTGDGVPDLVLFSPGITILPGLSGGGYGQPVDVPSASANSIAIADFNGDGRMDLAVGTSAGIEIRLGLSGGGLGAAALMNIGAVSGLAAGDVNGDGRADLAFVRSQGIRVVFGNGDGTFGPVTAPSTSFAVDNFRLVDLSGDGKSDLVSYSFGGLAIYIGDGAGNFRLKATQYVNASHVLVVDVNGDSRPDVIASADYTPTKVLLNEGDGGLGPATDILPGGLFGGQAVAGDFNGDGAIDIAIAVDYYIEILIGDGTGHFTESLAYKGAGSFLAADLDGDGRTDLVGVTGPYSPVSVWSLHDTNCTARRLSLTTNVGSCAPAGSAFSPQPVLRVTDDGGNLIACSSGLVTAALVSGTGTPGAALSGTTTVPVAGGIASFTNLSINLAGSGYRLRFTNSAGGAVRSRSVTVAAAPPSITLSNTCTVGAVRLETAPGADQYRWTIDGVVVGTLPSIAVSGLTAGSHALSLSVTRDGCTTVATQTLNVTASPAAPTASSNSPVPFWQTIQLSATSVGGATYQWTGPNGFSSTLQNPAIASATPAISGIYRVVAHKGGCSSTDGATTVTVLPATPCAGCGAASFGPGPRILTSAGASGVVAGDFNGDGIPDLAVIYTGVKVFPGKGGGYFGAPTASAAGPYLKSLLAVDLDRDKALDLVYLGPTALYVQLGHGTGSFEPPASFPLSGTPVDLAVGDFNEDGWPDVAVATQNPNQVALFLGTGAGSFASPSITPLSGSPRAFASGVLRPSGHRDLLIGLGFPNSVAVLLGAGNGTFSPGPSVTLQDLPFVLAIGDLDGDGAQDLVVSTSGFGSPSQLLLYRGNSDGSFSLQRGLPVGASGSLRIADLDADGHNDLVFLGNGGVSVLFGKGGWDFDTLRTSENFDSLINFDIADFDGDGRMDAAVAAGGFAEILRGVPGGFESTPTAKANPQPNGVLKGDFNGDGRLDLAITSSPQYPSSGQISILFNDAQGGFMPPVPLPGTGGGSSAAVAADLDGDGRTDLVVIHNYDVVVFHGSASGPPALYQTISVNFAGSLAIADFNGDGKLDLAVGTSSGVSIFPGDGAGGFSSGSQAINASVGSIQVGDFNGDGKRDLLLYGAIALGNGNGTFQPLSSIPFSVGTSYVVVGDLNGDGKDDLVGADVFSGIVVALSNGTGFQAPVTVAPFTQVARIEIADINGDGHKDLVLLRGTQDLVTILLSDGAGSYSAGGDFHVGTGPQGVVAADLDNDGRPDLIVPDYSAGTVSILHNTRCVPSHLGVAASPSCAPPGQVLSGQPVVGILDDGGNVVACVTGAVTAAIAPGTGTAGAVLGGTTSVNPINGVATFSNLSIDRAGAPYQLAFHHTGLPDVRSPFFSVGNPPAAPTAGSNGPVCEGQPLQLTATLVPGATYLWTGPNGFSAEERDPVIQDPSLAASGTYSVTLTVYRCSSSTATTSVTVMPIPAIKIVAPGSACPHAMGLTASVQPIAGATYNWSITNGTITGGVGTASITFTAGTEGLVQLAVTASAGGCSSTASKTVTIVPGSSCSKSFFTVTPCRVADTRTTSNGPALSAGTIRTFPVAYVCGVPQGATAVAVNIVVVEPTSGGDLLVYPYGQPPPLASSINFGPGVTRANNAIIPLGYGSLSVKCDMPSGGTHFIIDVYGYFE